MTKPAAKRPEAEKKTAGRPAGSKTATETAAVELSRCPKCGSTNRTPYAGQPVVNHFRGIDQQGNPFTRVLTRRTTCADCGQARRDKTREYHPEDAAK